MLPLKHADMVRETLILENNTFESVLFYNDEDNMNQG